MKKTLLYFLGVCLICGCSRNYVFQSAAPVTEWDNQKPSQVPKKTSFDFVEYSITSSSRYPSVRKMDPRRIPRSQDVNALDEVPSSTWFTPRLGTQSISPAELLKGPASGPTGRQARGEEVGPPQAPFKVFKAKTEGNSPGFHVEDSRGKRYLFKFDSGDFPALESTANLIVSRLFWGFGYNVPEDYLYHLNPDDLSIAGNSKVTQEDVERVLTFASIDEDGRYRVTASLFLGGEILGPIPQRGTRRGDSNDQIPHENLRVLRALRVFCAFTGNSGIRSDNSLDVYTGEPGKGHTVHYLLDFGEALGIHGIEKDRVWDGYEHFFSYQDSLLKFFSFGIPVQKWEKLKWNTLDPKGSFDAQTFELDDWRESVQFMPIRHARPEDDYWAAKILAALTPEHLEALFQAAQYPDPEYQKTMIQYLLDRRQKIFAAVFERVSPLESKGLQNGTLKIQDLGQRLLPSGNSTRYEVKIFNKGGRKMDKTFWIEASEGNFDVLISPEMLQRAKGYLRLEIRRETSERPAEFHVRADSSGTPQLAGIVH